MESNAPYEAMRDLRALWPELPPTPLVQASSLARHAGFAGVWLKLESERPLGNFKALGGMLAGVRALVRATGMRDVASLLTRCDERRLPALLCASEGNHGLAVAACAQRVGAPARVFLAASVSGTRVARIVATGAKVVRVSGTYDDAVDAAESAAMRSEGILVPDTSADSEHRVVRDVMAGYSVIPAEIAMQLAASGATPPDHVFVQAGVGGLAAAMAQGMHAVHAGVRTTVVEPAGAACVAHALRCGHAKRISGPLPTHATMLACGLASASAIEILRAHAVDAIQVDDAQLHETVKVLAEAGVHTTPSGAAGVAGLLAAARVGGTDPLRYASRTALTVVTETAL